MGQELACARAPIAGGDVTTYNVRLLETRLSDSSGDDAAIFAVTREENGSALQVATLLSPLFRLLHMESMPSAEARRDMAAGLGARAIAERLKQGLPIEDGGYLVFAERYPGAPGDPDPIAEYEQLAVQGGEGKRGNGAR
jgi:hypothetical protein